MQCFCLAILVLKDSRSVITKLHGNMVRGSIMLPQNSYGYDGDWWDISAVELAEITWMPLLFAVIAGVIICCCRRCVARPLEYGASEASLSPLGDIEIGVIATTAVSVAGSGVRLGPTTSPG
jgi:hypothetical protein